MTAAMNALGGLLGRGDAISAAASPERLYSRHLAYAAVFIGIVFLTWQFDAPLVLVAALAPAGAVLLLLKPEIATVITVFLLYTNVPAIVNHRYGIPMAVAGAFVFLWFIPLLQSLVLRRESLRWDRTGWLMVAYLCVLVASVAVAKDADITLTFAYRFALEGLLIYLLVINVVRTRTTLMKVLWTMLFAGGLLGSLAVYQEITGNYQQEFGGLAERNWEYAQLLQMDSEDPEAQSKRQAWLESYGMSEQSQRAHGPMDEPNRFAQVLVALVPIALLCFRHARNRLARASAAFLGVMVVGGLACSGSRGGFLALAVLLILAAYLGWLRKSHLVAGSLAIVLMTPIVAPTAVERAVSIVTAWTVVRDGASSSTDGAIKGRAQAMTAAARVAMDHPLLGVGAGQFQPFYSVEYQLNDPRFRFRSIRPYYTHSLYLQVAAESGVIGLVVFLSIFFFLLRAINRARRRWMTAHWEYAEMTAATGLALLGYLGTAVFLHLGLQRYLWFLVAIAGASLHILLSKSGRASARTLPTRRSTLVPGGL